MILVVMAGRTTVEAVELARDSLAGTGARVIGCVLNGVNPSSRYGRYYYYYKYRYKYQYAQHKPDGSGPEPDGAKPGAKEPGTDA